MNDLAPNHGISRRSLAAAPAFAGAPRIRALREAGTRVRSYIVIAPALFFLVAFTYFPLAKVIVGSLYQAGFAGAPATFAGLANYVTVFADPSFQTALVNSMQAVLTGHMRPAAAAHKSRQQAQQILAPYVAHAQHRAVQ